MFEIGCSAGKCWFLLGLLLWLWALNIHHIFLSQVLYCRFYHSMFVSLSSHLFVEHVLLCFVGSQTVVLDVLMPCCLNPIFSLVLNPPFLLLSWLNRSLNPISIHFLRVNPPVSSGLLSEILCYNEFRCFRFPSLLLPKVTKKFWVLDPLRPMFSP